MGEVRYRFGPFYLDIENHVLLRDGKDLDLKLQDVQVLRVLVEHPNELLSYENFGKHVWGDDTYVDVPHSLSQSISKIRRALGESYAQYIKTNHKIGYTFNRSDLDRDESASSESSEGRTSPESDGRGWRRDEVAIKRVGPYKPVEDFVSLMRQFEAEPPIRQYYSFQDYESRVKDEARLLTLYFQDSDWAHIYALNEAVKRAGMGSVCGAFRQRCEDDFMPRRTSRLCRNVNCEILVVSSDNQIVLGRRRVATRSGRGVPFFPGAWSTTLEEQMLRFDPEGKTNPDTDLFDCAHRGVTEELQVPIKTAETRLVGYGIEWLNFTAAFLFIVNIAADFATIAESWVHADDRIEAIALDALPATEESVANALLSKEWAPSSHARTWKSADAIAKDTWHPTARARLCAYLQHLEFLSGKK